MRIVLAFLLMALGFVIPTLARPRTYLQPLAHPQTDKETMDVGYDTPGFQIGHRNKRWMKVVGSAAKQGVKKVYRGIKKAGKKTWRGIKTVFDKTEKYAGPMLLMDIPGDTRIEPEYDDPPTDCLHAQARPGPQSHICH